MTRPDIAHAVSTLYQYLKKPYTTHIDCAQRVLCYLKGTRNHKLVLEGENFVLSGFTNANWATNCHRHLILGYCYHARGGAISWLSKKQPIIALLSCESEYVGLTQALEEALWLGHLARKTLPIVGQGLYISPFEPTALYCDNQGALKLASNPVFHARTKHINIHFHFVRQTIMLGDVHVTYTYTDNMVADIFTKPLG